MAGIANASAQIAVKIVGDSKSLEKALGGADSSLGKIGGGLGKIAIGLGAIGVAGAGFDFLQGALAESDRLGDALTRLTGQLGPDFTAQLDKTASGFANLGQSRQDVLELEAAFADTTTTLGLTDDAITTFAPNVVSAAAALSLVKDADPSEILDQITKAAGGSEKAAKALGVTLLAGVDPSTQLQNILSQLAPTLDAVSAGGADVESQQKKLGAQWETLQGNVGQLVEGPLTDLLGFINDEIEALPHAIDGFAMLGRAIVKAFEDALSPIARLNDALGDLGDALRGIPFLGDIVGGIFGGSSERGVRDAQSRFNERNQGRP